MSNYRRTIYRYSTGEGPNLAAKIVPQEQWQTAAYKFRPLRHMLSLPDTEVNLKREADRVSYQVEEADRIIKVMGYDSDAAKKRDKLKDRLDLINHLLMNFPLTKIKYEELERLHNMWASSSKGVDAYVEKLITESNESGSDKYIKSAASTRKGYPVIDKFGQVVAMPKNAPTKAAGLGELGTMNKDTLIKLVTIAVLLMVGYRLLK